MVFVLHFLSISFLGLSYLGLEDLRPCHGIAFLRLARPRPCLVGLRLVSQFSVLLVLFLFLVLGLSSVLRICLEDLGQFDLVLQVTVSCNFLVLFCFSSLFTFLFFIFVFNLVFVISFFVLLTSSSPQSIAKIRLMQTRAPIRVLKERIS